MVSGTHYTPVRLKAFSPHHCLRLGHLEDRRNHTRQMILSRGFCHATLKGRVRTSTTPNLRLPVSSRVSTFIFHFGVLLEGSAFSTHSRCLPVRFNCLSCCSMCHRARTRQPVIHRRRTSAQRRNRQSTCAERPQQKGLGYSKKCLRRLRCTKGGRGGGGGA